jgi:5'-3' exonuclease
MKVDTLIIDGRHALWRTSDAFKMLSAEIGKNIVGTGGIYGFICLASRVHQKYGGKTIVAWEGKNNFRKVLYEHYKEKSSLDEEQLAIIEDMREQERRLKAILRAMGVEQYYGIRCEADDVIGRLSVENSKNEEDLVIIYSGDSDLRQLVKDNVYVASPGYKGSPDVIYDQQRVYEKHGVIPGNIADLKALSGDSSDNIPGLKGIGDKRAVQLINAYGDVEGVIEGAIGKHKAEWPLNEKFKGVVSENIEQLRLYKELTTIRVNMPMEIIKPNKNKDLLLKHFSVYRFASLMAKGEMHELMRISSGN